MVDLGAEFLKRVLEVYSERASDWDRVGATIRDVEGEDNQISRVMADYVEDSIVMVDLGCGTGKMLSRSIRLAEEGLFVAVDGSREMAYRARQRLTSAVKTQGTETSVIVSPMESVPLPDNFADITTAKQVLQHVGDPLVAIREMARITKPGGHVLIMVPGKRYQTPYFPPLGDRKRRDKLGRFTENELHDLAMAAGLWPNDFYVNQFKFTFDNMLDYFIFMHRVGALSRLFDYRSDALVMSFIRHFAVLFRETTIPAVPGEYITMDCIKKKGDSNQQRGRPILPICRWDNAPMRFHPSVKLGDIAGHEGVFACTLQGCPQCYLVTSDIIIAPPNRFLDETDRELLEKRCEELNLEAGPKYWRLSDE